MPGGVGPKLTDAYWLHGGGLKDIFKTLNMDGLKGMIMARSIVSGANSSN
ncbi:MAG: hypothetical protein IPH96_18220 [Saprospiraceae bacterium]|nr:hypothetical protein [Saprospiraceae bacterium]